MGLAASIADVIRAVTGREKPKRFTSAVILAAGSSERMGYAIPSKQLYELDGIPVVVRSMLAFQNNENIDEIIAVVRSGEEETYSALREKYALTKLVKIIVGRDTRQKSALAGFDAINEKADFVALHDGARCLVTNEMINRVCDAAYEHGAATAATRSVDSVKLATAAGFIESSLDRDKIYLVSTPQIFSANVYRASAYTAKDAGFEATDDCSLAERAGFPVRIVEVGSENIKITTPCDLESALMIIKRRENTEK